MEVLKINSNEMFVVFMIFLPLMLILGYGIWHFIPKIYHNFISKMRHYWFEILGFWDRAMIFAVAFGIMFIYLIFTATIIIEITIDSIPTLIIGLSIWGYVIIVFLATTNYLIKKVVETSEMTSQDE